MPFWQDLTRKGFLEAIEQTDVAIMVTGALEPHGDHLPLGTDNLLPAYLAKIAAEKTNALVLPPINMGSSWIFNKFAGTITIDPVVLVQFYRNVMEGIFKQGTRHLIVLNGHGGNVGHLEAAAQYATEHGEGSVIIVNWWRELADNARSTVLESPEGHAAEDETSEVMYVAPHLVKMEDATKAMVKTRFRVVSGSQRRELIPDATYGDPTKASMEKGKLIMEQAAEEFIELIQQLEKGDLPFVK
ncbi:MAG: creatininase family protein [Candidatus Thorarchaeota archaeon]